MSQRPGITYIPLASTTSSVRPCRSRRTDARDSIAVDDDGRTAPQRTGRDVDDGGVGDRQRLRGERRARGREKEKWTGGESTHRAGVVCFRVRVCR